MQKYVNYLYYTDNNVYYPDGSHEYQNQIFMDSRIVDLKPKGTSNFFNALEKYQVLKQNPILNKYQDLGFYKTLTFYTINSTVFVLLGIIILVLSIFFINFCLGKELKSYRSEIFILKANGYFSREISLIWWLRTLIILFIGFIVGFFLGFLIQILLNQFLVINSNIIIEKIWLNPTFILVFILILPLVLSLINYLYLLKVLNGKNHNHKVKRLNNFVNKVQAMFSKVIDDLSFHQISRINSLIAIPKNSHSFLIFIIFIFVELLMLFELSSKNFINQSMDKISPVYNRQIDSSFSLNYQYNWITNQDKITLINNDNFDLKQIDYEKFSDLADLIVNPQTIALSNAINKYLMINRSENINLIRFNIISSLADFLTLDVNHGFAQNFSRRNVFKNN